MIQWIVSLMVAVIATVLAFVATFFVTYWLAFGEYSLVLWCLIPVAIGIWAFIATFKKVTAYISN